jgi:peptidoglycan hydrolase-like protein with peptidoglycan-binding domain
MGMMEVAYQLKDHAQVVVGSEELEPGKGWDYAALVAYLVQNPTASNEEVSKEIIRSFMASYETQSSLKVTLASIRTSKLEKVAKLMNVFAHTILRKESNVRGALLSVVDATETFDYQNNEQIYRDLKHFILLTKEHYSDDEEICKRADRLLLALEELMVESQSRNFKNANGLSVYLPLVNNMSGFAVAVFSALDINQEEAAPYWLKLFKQIGNIDDEANSVYGEAPLEVVLDEPDDVDEIVEDESHLDMEESISFTDLLPLPSSMNEGLQNARNSLLYTLLGNPHSTYSMECSHEGPMGELGQRMVWDEDVGPFTVSGFDLAVDSLREVLAEARTIYPELVDALSSAGMLCCRYVRGSETAISTHSWGIAIDLKVDGELDKPYDQKVQYGLSLLAPIFNKHGWYWGAAFPNEDAMHFELSQEKMLEWEAEGKLLKRAYTFEEKPSFYTVLRLGDRGQAVLELQRKLNHLGYALIEDGIFGNETYYVVIDFQREHQLVEDGIVGVKTMEAIERLVATRAIGSVKIRTPDLKFGARSRWVQVAQAYLNRYGFELMENGLFDKLMLQAVYDFQKALGVKPTGMVDANLWFVLQNPSRSKVEVIRHIPTLVLGDANCEVLAIQSALEAQGYKLPHDGYFGLETQMAVKKFQEKRGLAVTGEVDEATYNIIIN